MVDMIRAYNTAAIEYAASGSWTELVRQRVFGYDSQSGSTSTNSAIYDYLMALDFEKSPGDCRLHMYDWPDPSVTPYDGLFHRFLNTAEINVGYIVESCIDVNNIDEIIAYQENLLENIINHYQIPNPRSSNKENPVKFVSIGEWGCSQQDIADAMNKLRSGEADVILGALPVLDSFTDNGVFGCASFGDDIGIIRRVINNTGSSDDWKNLGSLQETIRYIINSQENYAIVTRSNSPVRNLLLGVPNENIFTPNEENYKNRDYVYYIDETIYILKRYGTRGEFIHNFFNGQIYRYGPMFPFAGYIEGYGNSQLTQALNYAIDEFFRAPGESGRKYVENNKYYELLDVKCPDSTECKFSLPISSNSDEKCGEKISVFTGDVTICLNSLQRVWVQTYYPLLYLGKENAFTRYGSIFIPDFGFPGTTGFKALPKSSVTKYGKLNYAIVSGYLKYGVGPRHYGYNTANSFVSNVLNSLGTYLGEKYGRTVSFVEVFDSFLDENRARCMLSGQTPTSREYGQVKPSADLVLAPKLNLDEYYSDYTIDLFHTFLVEVTRASENEVSENEKRVVSNSVISITSDYEPKGKYDIDSNEVKVRKLMIELQDSIVIESPRFMTSWLQLYLTNSSKINDFNNKLSYSSPSSSLGSAYNLQVSFDYNQPEIEIPRDEIASLYSGIALGLGIASLVLGIVLLFLHLFGKDTPKYVEDSSGTVPQINISRDAMIAAPIAAGPLPDAELL